MSEGMMPPPPPEAAPVAEPARIKVFGVIHIVFGALGLLFTVVNLVGVIAAKFLMGFVMETALKQVPSSEPGAEKVKSSLQGLMGAYEQFLSETAVVNWVAVITGLIVSVLILLAGIGLVRRRKGSVGASNRYAVCSIAAKIVNLVLMLTVTMAATRKLQEAVNKVEEELGGGTGPAAAPALDAFQNAAAMGMGLAFLLVSLVYPVLTLIMLNKPVVKDYLAQHGK